MQIAKYDEAGTTETLYRMRSGDVQFTSAGRNVAHSKENEDDHQVYTFLQTWVLPWKRWLKSIYHHGTVLDDEERRGFVTIVSPLKGGINATPKRERNAEPVVAGTIPIHAVFLFGAGIILLGWGSVWQVGGDGAVRVKRDSEIYVFILVTDR